MDPFAAISDPVRRGLLEQLATQGPTRVIDLTRGRGISRPAVSRHLRVLGDAGLVRAVERGRERHYELVPAPLAQVSAWVGGVIHGQAPPVSERQLDALDLEVRRTVRERAGEAAARHTDQPAPEERGGRNDKAGESA